MTTQTQQRLTNDDELIGRAPAHDGVATQRDLRETERYLAGKIDRLMWLIIGGLGAVVVALIGMVAALVALIVQL